MLHERRYDVLGQHLKSISDKSMFLSEKLFDFIKPLPPSELHLRFGLRLCVQMGLDLGA